MQHRGTLSAPEPATAQDTAPPTVEDLRASMQQILETPATKRKPERKRAAKRPSKAERVAAETEELDEDQWREKARGILLRQLTASDKSAKQLKDKLLEKECPEDIAEEVIQRFIDVDLVDDEKFANAWVRARTRTRGLARGALKHELRSKGIDDEIAQMALDQVDDQDEEERARELVRAKLRPESMGLDRDKALRRLVGMLGRKGYNGSLAFKVAREEWDARFRE
ncbi:recombination regulator RecX [Glutamicibacter sp. MNS18]|uniref:regulatory protein RecX n=1 Tax=Glutamicibacter sp. MNS18 TaxID=2989817 RepID=UPI0022361AEC|nr:regulatory protein RecX [Glutamicibacter sp. MNS18]MCW4465341.1 recombination regulator RecX [Glutamicibacter sp. MNS18]